MMYCARLVASTPSMPDCNVMESNFKTKIPCQVSSRLIKKVGCISVLPLHAEDQSLTWLQIDDIESTTRNIRTERTNPSSSKHVLQPLLSPPSLPHSPEKRATTIPQSLSTSDSAIYSAHHGSIICKSPIHATQPMPPATLMIGNLHSRTMIVFNYESTLFGGRCVYSPLV